MYTIEIRYFSEYFLECKMQNMSKLPTLHRVCQPFPVFSAYSGVIVRIIEKNLDSILEKTHLMNPASLFH